MRKANEVKMGGKWEGRVAEMARRMGEAARARRVILFGSAARGEMRKHSDWDFLVVVADRRHRWKAYSKASDAVREIRREWDCPSTDIIVAREAEVARWRDCHYSVIHEALKDGRELWRV